MVVKRLKIEIFKLNEMRFVMILRLEKKVRVLRIHFINGLSLGTPIVIIIWKICQNVDQRYFNFNKYFLI